MLPVAYSHWGIAKQLRSVLDLAFRGDERRVRDGDAAKNLAVLHHLALKALRQERTAQVGVQSKRRMAG